MPLFPGIPYGQAPGWCFPVFECSLYVLMLFCLADALKKGPGYIMYLLGGLVFGLLLEYMEVVMGSYTYGRFWVMLGKTGADIPLCIGVGWGIIMYTARLFTEKLGLTIWAAAAFDTLLALNIDLSMDTVAYRMHMWHWDWSHTTLNPLTAQWFGIPFGNFIGWQTVVFCYSLVSRLLQRYLTSRVNTLARQITVTVLALISSLAVLYITEMLWPLTTKYLHIQSVHRFAVICVILILLVIFGWRNRRAATNALPGIAWWVPAWFHFFFAACLFLLGFYSENVWLTVAAITNLCIGVVIHIFLYKIKVNRR